MDNVKVSKQYNLGVVAELDEFGNTVTVALDAAPQWTLTDPALGVIEASPDGLTAVLKPTGALGACQLQVVALSAGKTLLGTDDLTFIAGDAVKFSLSIAEGADKSPA